MRQFIAVLTVLFLLTPAGVRAQEGQTLADVRQELSVLYVELQKLKRELSTTGSAGLLSSGGTQLDRLNTIEAEVQRLTRKTEELEFRIDKVVSDGTNRVGDLEFRLCELEKGCDVSKLEPGSTLGGIAPATPGSGSAVQAPTEDAPQLAVGEKSDFERAEAALQAGSFAEAAAQFEAFQKAYPGGPLTGRAGLLRGDALEGAGDTGAAARVYLEAFSSAPDGPEAPEVLFRLGRSLGRLGQKEDACLMLGQVENRYPQAEAVTSARNEMSTLGCQ